MLRLKCRITFTPKQEIIPSNAAVQSVSAQQLATALANPLSEERAVVVFDFINEIECYSSFLDLVATAKITLPRKLVTLEGKPIATAIGAYFRRGDSVKIELGYAPQLRTVFEGYISRVFFHTPIVIECQDEMFRLMQKHVIYPLVLDYQYTGQRGQQLKRPKVITQEIKLDKLLREVLLNDDKLRDIQSNFECVDTTVYINDRFDSSVYEVLHKVKSEYGLQSYFRDKVLHVGFESDATKGDTIEFEFEENIISDRDLNFQLEDDVILRVRVESIDTHTNHREHLIVGDDFGEQRDYKMLNANKEQMKVFALDKLNTHKYTGYRGTFLTFGENYARPGDIAQLTSKKFPEKNGSYQIKSVKRTFGMGGYRQTIELGARLTF